MTARASARIALRRSFDVDRNRALFARGLPGDPWPGDHHAFWVATAADGTPAGFCSAVILAGEPGVFLSSAAVFRPYRGLGLQRRMIRLRLQWARRQGAKYALTYTVAHNWPSATSLLACGFRHYEPAYPYVGKDMWYWVRDLG